MDFTFSLDQEQFKGSVRSFLSDKVTTEDIRKSWETNDAFNLDRWKSLGSLGVLSANLKESHGGLNVDYVAMALIAEEMGYYGLPEPAAEQIFLTNSVLNYLDSSQLDNILFENAYIGFSHPLSPYILSAHKASGIIFYEEPHFNFLPLDQCVLESLESNDPSRNLFRIKKLKGEPMCLKHKFKNLNKFIESSGMLMSSALLLGLSRRMLDLTKIYVNEREQFGKPIGSFQAVKHMLADAAINIEFSKSFIYRAASSLDTMHSMMQLHSYQAKYMSMQASEIVTKNCLQAHGAMGYTWEMDLHIFARRGWSLKGIWGDQSFLENNILRKLENDLPNLGSTYTFMDS